jgi:hypothetical protein
MSSTKSRKIVGHSLVDGDDDRGGDGVGIGADDGFE